MLPLLQSLDKQEQTLRRAHRNNEKGKEVYAMVTTNFFPFILNMAYANINKEERNEEF